MYTVKKSYSFVFTSSTILSSMDEEKKRAVEFIQSNKIDIILQQTLNDLYRSQPTNVFGYLSEELDKFATKPTIHVVSGYNVKSVHSDSDRISVEVTCHVQNHKEVLESATIGHNSADDKMDLDDMKAVNDALQGVPILGQECVDEKLVSSEVSPSIKLSVSTAVFKSNSRLQKMSLLDAYGQQFNLTERKMPVPIVSIMSSGKHAPGKNNISSLAIMPKQGLSFEKGMEIMESVYKATEEYLKKKNHNNAPSLSPLGAFIVSCDRPEQMIEMIKEAVGELEIHAGSDFFFVLDCLASDFHSEVTPGQGSAKKGQVRVDQLDKF